MDGGWGGTSLLGFGGLQNLKMVQKEEVFGKLFRRNAVNISVFAFCGLLPWKMQSLNSSLFTVFYACVF